MSERLFRISTIFNDSEKLDSMRSTFERAGFSDENAAFEIFDNTKRNIYEPYTTFNRVLDTATEPYLVFCHQDVLPDRGDDFESLHGCVEEMNRQWPDWAVLGNGGMDADFQLVRCVSDPHRTSRDWPLPRRVVSLDENFLVVNREAAIRFSKRLSGFHFYGIDLCMNAYMRKRSCFVIDFQVTHLSGGQTDTEFRRIEKEFQNYWSRHFAFFYAASPGTTVFFSRYAPVAWFFRKCRVRKHMQQHHRRFLRKAVEKFINTP